MRVKKNVVKDLFLTKTIHLLLSELEVLEQQMRYPDFFKEKAELEQINPLITLSSLPAGVNQIDIMEIASGIYYLLLEIGVPKVLFAFTRVARTFSWLFGFRFDDIYKRRDDVLKRTPEKRTLFLQRMIEAIIKESKRKGYL